MRIYPVFYISLLELTENLVHEQEPIELDDEI